MITFIDKVTGKPCNAGEEVLISDERIAEIKAVNVNMVLVMGEVEAEPVAEPIEEMEAEPKTKGKKK